MKHMKKNTISKQFATLIAAFTLIASCVQAQSFDEIDYVVSNKLYDFLIEYERTSNAPTFIRSDFNKFYYNDNVEVFNDLKNELPEYITFGKYLETLDSIKSKNSGFEFYHYDLELIKQQTGHYYDIVNIRLLKEVVDNTIIVERNIDSTVYINSNLLDFTLVFYKYENAGEFKILRVEKANSSMLPDAWCRKTVPDEVRIAMGPSFVNFTNVSSDLISITNDIGFDGSLTILNRFTGGTSYAAYWYAGLGATYINSNWFLQYDSTEVANQVDNFGDAYTRRIVSTGIDQDIDMFYIKAPLGVAFRMFNSTGFSLIFSGEIAPRYLLRSNYVTNNGDVTYSGIYTETINGQNYPFYLANLGSLEKNDYDFFKMQARKNRNEINFEKFGMSAGFSVQACYKVGDHFDVFIAPSWKWGITNMFTGSEPKVLALNNWEAAPVIELERNVNFNSTTIEAGIIFRLNNVVKPFIRRTHFKDQVRQSQKANFEKYMVNKIPFDPYEYVEPQKKTISVNIEKELKNTAPRINYSFSPKKGISNKELKPGNSNKVKATHKGMFMFKPFGYEINTQFSPRFSTYDEILTDSLDATHLDFEMTRLKDINVSIIMNMNDTRSGLRSKIIQTYRNNVSRSDDEICALYFYEMHGNSIKEIYKSSENQDFCINCNNYLALVDLIEKKTSPAGDEPVVNLFNELRILLKDDFQIERRSINLDFYIGNPTSFSTAINNLQQFNNANAFVGESWYDDDENISNELEELRELFENNPLNITQFKHINFYIDFNEDIETKITDTYYRPNVELQSQEFVRNTYKALYQYIKSGGKGKKSIRLRNFEFIQM